MSKAQIVVVILNFNGKSFLEKFLHTTIKYSSPHEIYVADNGSTDNSIEYLKSNFPSIKIIDNKFNFGYAKGNNEPLKQISAEYFVLLNNDVEVTENWLTPLLNLMQSDTKIAACQPKLLDYSNKNTFEYAGGSGGFIDKYAYPFCRGRIFNTIEEDKKQYDSACEVFWASGACLCVNADAFWKAGGLDEDFFAHMEEIDLCWRLKNLGYKIYIEPSSIIYHVGGGTLNKLSSQKTFLNFRNNLITLTKNHPPKYLFLKFIFRLNLDGIAAFKFLLSGEPKHFFAVLRAHFAYYFSLSNTLKKRKALKKIEGFKFNLSCVYKGNIVMEYFVRGKKTFSDLHRGFFD